jgi:hypothetical protein
MDLLTFVLHAAVFVAGLALVVFTLFSVVETFILPRSANGILTRWVFLLVLRPFAFFVHRAKTYEERDHIMAFFAPTSLLVLPLVWLAFVMTGYMLMYWAIGYNPIEKALELSGSSLLTLGFVQVEGNGLAAYLMAFSEAAIGLILIALLIAYLPTIYSAFQRREQMVNMLEVRAGSPPAAWELIARYHRIHGLDRLTELWMEWERWFADVEESQTSIGAVVFFRSPKPTHSWITAAGTILDAAALVRAAVDMPRDPQADLCIRAGYLTLRRICDFFRIPYNPNPKPDDPISVERAEFEQVCDDLAARGVPIQANREQAWRDFVGWRVNYDLQLLALARLTMAPYAPWITDRVYHAQGEQPPAMEMLEEHLTKEPRKP